MKRGKETCVHDSLCDNSSSITSSEEIFQSLYGSGEGKGSQPNSHNNLLMGKASSTGSEDPFVRSWAGP